MQISKLFGSIKLTKGGFIARRRGYRDWRRGNLGLLNRGIRRG